MRDRIRADLLKSMQPTTGRKLWNSNRPDPLGHFDDRFRSDATGAVITDFVRDQRPFDFCSVDVDILVPMKGRRAFRALSSSVVKTGSNPVMAMTSCSQQSIEQSQHN